MREIIFRGKHAKSGEWVVGDLIQAHQPLKSILEGGVFYPIDDTTVGQYTGYDDATDTGVYEGDIVEFLSRIYDEDGCVMFEATRIGYVRLSFGQWSVRIPEINTSTNLYGIDSRKIVVIGNIHDNPELVEEES